ncbi:ABC transporter substrate-binding protein [Roseomonas sp. 18066]|uniref:ABC transporter substrate-binding protein n=1 Tax=Roseomonas sp. 18066 TaxID=2681412 RepID=UPI00190F3340|nr:ABC transporter substrate-binding protein [Roseomonas sp. 18066]
MIARRGLLGALGVLASRRAGAATPRLVSLDLALTEALLTLRVTPLAVANLPLYRRLVGDPALPEGVIELGPQQEPNLELLQALRPDRILAADWQAAGLRRLSEIAPLSLLPVFAADGDALGQGARLLRALAALAGADPEPAIAAATAGLAAAARAVQGLDDRPVLLFRLMEDARGMAVFGSRGMPGGVLARLGLRNAWQGRQNAAGVASAGIEALATMPEARLIHFDRGAETARALSRLEASRFWQALPALRAGRIAAMPVIYPNGGLASAGRLARQIADRLPELARHG